MREVEGGERGECGGAGVGQSLSWSWHIGDTSRCGKGGFRNDAG
jgi:hypothetical protein